MQRCHLARCRCKMFSVQVVTFSIFCCLVVLFCWHLGTKAEQSRELRKIAKVFRMLWRWLQLSADVHKWPQSCPGRSPLSLVPSVQCSLQSTVSRVLSRGSCSSLGCWLPINLLLLAVAVQRKQMITLRVRNLSNQSSQGWLEKDQLRS